MNKCVLIASCLVLAMAFAGQWAQVEALPKPQDTYSDKYDNIDLDAILGSKRLIRNYISCFNGKGPCTPDGTYLSQILPDALKTECAKCNEKQKQGAIKAIKKLSSEYPEEWAEITAKLDPTGELFAKFKAANL